MRRSSVVAFALLLAGFMFRAWGSQHAQFNFDQTWFWEIALDIVHGEAFPAYGSLISGSQARVPSPLFHYLCAIPQLVTDHPMAGSLFFCLLHLLNGYALYWVAKLAASERAALTMVALYAFMPYDVQYGHSIWLGCLLPVYGVGVVVTAFAARSSARAQGLLTVLFFAGPALHLSLPVVWVSGAIVLVLRRPKFLSFKAIAIGTVIGVSFFVPMLLEELTNNWFNTRAVMSQALGRPPAAPWRSAAQAPVFAVLFSSSEMQYFFNRGYWFGFDAVGTYSNVVAWGTRLYGEGLLRGGLTIVSVLLAVFGWSTTIFRTAKDLRQKLRDRKSLGPKEDRNTLGLSDATVLTLTLFGTLCTSFILLGVGRKVFFPHYITVMAPLCLWPVALAIDSLTKRQGKLRWAAAVVVGLSSISMLVNNVAYYKNAESLNGLVATLELTEWMVKEETPVDLRFIAFDNTYPIRKLAKRLHGKTLRVSKSAPVRFTVFNEASRPDFVDTPDKRAFGFAPLVVERTQVGRARPSGVVFDALSSWRTGTLEYTPKGKPSRPCRMRSEWCVYGSNSWERTGPDVFSMKSKLEPLLFFHPLANASLKMSYRIPPKAKSGVLLYGLSDAASSVNNPNPVMIRLFQGEQHIASLQAPSGAPGLHTHPFTLTATGARSIAIEVTTKDQAARNFGYDLQLFDR